MPAIFVSQKRQFAASTSQDDSDVMSDDDSHTPRPAARRHNEFAPDPMPKEWHPKLNGRGWSLGDDTLFPIEVAEDMASNPSSSHASKKPRFVDGLLPKWYLGDLSKLPVGLREGMRKPEDLSVSATFLSFRSSTQYVNLTPLTLRSCVARQPSCEA